MAQAIYGTGPQSFPASTRFLRELAEGGQFLLEKDPASTLNGVDIVVDTLGDRVRVFEGAAPSRGVHIDLLQGGNGTSARLTSTLDFDSSLSSVGWQRLPSGLIIQWGQLTVSAGGSVVTFPIAFPNMCFSISGIVINATTHADVFECSGSITASNFNCAVVSTNPAGNVQVSAQVRWIAIGH